VESYRTGDVAAPDRSSRPGLRMRGRAICPCMLALVMLAAGVGVRDAGPGPILVAEVVAREEASVPNGMKMGPDLKYALTEAQDSLGDEPRLTLLVRTRGPAVSEVVRAVGAELRSQAGDIATVTLPASRVAELAAQDWVLQLELSRPLDPEAGAAD
jgi:hypothetical protein